MISNSAYILLFQSRTVKLDLPICHLKLQHILEMILNLKYWENIYII